MDETICNAITKNGKQCSRKALENNLCTQHNNIKKREKIKIDNKTIRFIDLFCGLGAFHEAFNRNSNNNIKYKCVFACDINKDVRNIYKENYDILPEGDINKIKITEIPDCDIICAGFPCQPFSIAGNKLGFNDKNKGNLFYKILEIIDIKKPKILILENVKNLHSIDKGKTFKIITNELEKRGFIINYKVIDSKYYNSPQSRKRIYIICNKNKKYIFNNINKKIKPVSDIIDKSYKQYFKYEEKYKLVECDNKSSMMKYKLINKKTNKGGRQGERVYSINNYGPTICASSGGPGAKTGLYEIENKKIRTLNIKETLKMFGFKETYKYTTLKNKNKMLFYLGNSIVVEVLNNIINNLKHIL
jgi:DNA (cytosine-5)-methyltransferase 1